MIGGKTFLLLGSIVIALCSLSIMTADTNTAGRVVYIRDIGSETLAVDYETGQSTIVFGGRCTKFSPDLQFVAMFNLLNPQFIEIVSLADGVIVRQISWDLQWGRDMTGIPCRFSDWADTDVIVVVHETQDLQTRISVSDGLTETEEQTFIQVSPPLLHPRSQVPPVFSTNRELVVYRRCEDVECQASFFAIYNTSSNIIEARFDPNVGDLFAARPLIGDTVFSWSHNNRYLAYTDVETKVAIFDRSNQSQLDLSFVPSTIASTSKSSEVKWSPDSTAVAFVVGGASRMGYAYDWGIIIFDLTERAFKIVEISEDDRPFGNDSLQWLPSGEGMLLANREGSLHALDFSTESLSFVDDNVISILVWFAPPESTPTLPLRLTSLCSPDPDTMRVWRVRNTNADPVSFTWDVVGTDQTGSGTVPGGTEDNPGEVTFETVAVEGPNTTRIFVDGEQQDVKASTPDACEEEPRESVDDRIRLTSICSDDPTFTRRWRVRNTNPYPVRFTWDVVGTDQQGEGVVPAGSDSGPSIVFFEADTVGGANTTRIFVGGQQQDVKASGGAQCAPDGGS